MILGSIGAIACLAAALWVWSLSSRLRDSVESISGRITHLLSQVHSGSDEVAIRIESTREDLADLDSRIDKEITQLAEKAKIDPVKLDELERSITALIGRLADWRALYGSASELGVLLEELFRSAIRFIKTDDQTRDEVMAAIRNGITQIETASLVLDELQANLAVIRQQGKGAGKPMKPLFTRIDQVMAGLQDHTVAFSKGVMMLERAADNLARDLSRRIRLGTGIISFLLAWQAAAQCCLALWGWRQGAGFRRRAPA